MLFIYLNYSLRHHRNMSILPCSTVMIYSLYRKKKQTCRLPHCFRQHIVITYWVHPNESDYSTENFEKWYIASIPIADILQKDEHHVGVLKGHRIQCIDCTLPVNVQTWGKKKKRWNTWMYVWKLFLLPSSIRFSESPRTEEIEASGGVSLERCTDWREFVRKAMLLCFTALAGKSSEDGYMDKEGEGGEVPLNQW